MDAGLSRKVDRYANLIGRTQGNYSVARGRMVAVGHFIRQAILR